MPLYEYDCSKCGRFEIQQSMKDSPITICPTCGGPIQRLISKNVGIVFKGPGFYVTDNKPASKKETPAS